MGDEELYLIATNELEGENKDPALWAKVMALTEGDAEKAKYQYIKLRVEQLKASNKEKTPIVSKKTVDQFNLKYMPIAEFSKIRSIPENKIIEMIREGIYVGQIKDNEWFVSRDEEDREDGTPRHIKAVTSQLMTRTKQEYIPVEEFAEKIGITSEKAITMIRDGIYQGRLIDGKWYAVTSEIEETPNSSKSKSERLLSKIESGDLGIPKKYKMPNMIRNVLLVVIFIAGLLAMSITRIVQAELNIGYLPSMIVTGIFVGVFWLVYSKKY